MADQELEHALCPHIVAQVEVAPAGFRGGILDVLAVDALQRGLPWPTGHRFERVDCLARRSRKPQGQSLLIKISILVRESRKEQPPRNAITGLRGKARDGPRVWRRAAPQRGIEAREIVDSPIPEESQMTDHGECRDEEPHRGQCEHRPDGPRPRRDDNRARQPIV